MAGAAERVIMDGMAGSFSAGAYGASAVPTSVPASTAGTTVRTSIAIPTIALTTVDTRTGRPTVSAAHAASTKGASAAAGVASVVGPANGPSLVANTTGVSMSSTKEPPTSKAKARSTNGGMRSPSPTDRAETALRDCIFDYLSRTGLRNAADALKTELGATGHSIKAPPFGKTPQPILLDWFSLFLDKYMHHARKKFSRANMDRAAALSRNGRGSSLPNLVNNNRIPNHRPNTPRSQSHPRLNGPLVDQPFSNLRYSQNPQLAHTSLPPRHTQSHSPTFPLTLEQNAQAMLGLDAAVSPHPAAIATSLGVSSIDAMFNHAAEPSATALKKRPAASATAAAATSAAVANAVSGAPDRSSRSTQPKAPFVSAVSSTTKAMEEVKKAGALEDIPQVRGKRAFPQTPRGGSNPVASAAGAFNKAATNTKRQRTSTFPRGISGTNVSEPPIPDHLTKKMGKIMQEKLGVADPNGAAAAPDLTQSGFPPDALPVQEIAEGVIYVQQNQWKLWPGGNAMAMPSEPMKVQELQVRAEAARKAKTDSGAMLLGLPGAPGDSGRAEVAARAAAAAHMPQISSRSQLNANIAARPTTQNPLSSLGERDVTNRTKLSVARPGTIAAPSQTASNSGIIARSMELNTGNISSATGMAVAVEMDDSISTPSVGQESTGPTMSQRSSGSVGSTGRRAHGSARAGRGSRVRGKGRRSKTSDGNGSANAGINTKTSTSNGRSTPKSGGRKGVPKNATSSMKRENDSNRVSIGDTLNGSEDHLTAGQVPASNQQRLGSTAEATQAFADNQLFNLWASGGGTRTGPDSNQFDSALGAQQQLTAMTPTRGGDTALPYDEIQTYLAPGAGVDVSDLNTMLSLNGGNRMDANSNFIDETGILDSAVLDGGADATTLGMGLGRGL